MSEELSVICFEIITYVGTARSCFINAIQCAKKGEFEQAEQMIKQGDEAFSQGHDAHADLLQKMQKVTCLLLVCFYFTQKTN